LPPDDNPRGERGEFHTFCHAGPIFDSPIPISVGKTVERDGFWFADLLPGKKGKAMFEPRDGVDARVNRVLFYG
jgi:hypothetical protein